MNPRHSRSVLALLLATALVGGAAAPAFAEDEVPAPPVSETPATSENPESPEPTEAPNPGPEEPADETPTPEQQDMEAVEEAVPADPAEVEDLFNGTEGDFAQGGVASDTRNVRIQGSDRFATAVEISKHGYPSTASTVFVATGLDYPDSLSAAPVAAKLNAPLLLATQGSLPAVTATEIKRLKPTRIIVVGGENAIGSAVAAQLQSLVANVTVERVQGATRFETSIALSKKGWPTAGSAANAFIATGYGFADALSAGPAAKRVNGPVLLVPGGSPAASPATKAELVRLNNTRMYVAGGTTAVSDGVVNSLKRTSSHAVTRYAGADRYATSALIVNAHFSTTAASYWASGTSFADALTGAAVAGNKNAPLLLSLPGCMPAATYSANDARNPSNTYLLGGAAALNDTVLWGNECITARADMTAADISGTQHIYSRINQTRYNLNLQGARFYGPPAQNWTVGMANSNWMRLNPNLATQQPWVAEEYVLKDPTANNANPEASFAYMYSRYPQVVRFPNKPAGQRMWVSAGWINRVSGGYPTGWMTVYSGVR